MAHLIQTKCNIEPKELLKKQFSYNVFLILIPALGFKLAFKDTMEKILETVVNFKF